MSRRPAPRACGRYYGIRRTIGAAAQGKAPATADVLTAMLALCPATLAGHRDRALLALGFAGAFRHSELVALGVTDLSEVPDGLRVRIRRSKSDQEGEEAEIAIPRGYRLRPVEAVQIWTAAAGIYRRSGVPPRAEGWACAGSRVRDPLWRFAPRRWIPTSTIAARFCQPAASAAAHPHRDRARRPTAAPRVGLVRCPCCCCSRRRHGRRRGMTRHSGGASSVLLRRNRPAARRYEP